MQWVIHFHTDVIVPVGMTVDGKTTFLGVVHSKVYSRHVGPFISQADAAEYAVRVGYERDDPTFYLGTDSPEGHPRVARLLELTSDVRGQVKGIGILPPSQDAWEGFQPGPITSQFRPTL